MSNNNQPYQVCPVCYVNPIAPPNGVCSVCCNKLKKEYIHSSEYWDEKRNNTLISFDPQIHEQNILWSINDEIKRWNEITQNGLNPVKVLTDILDHIDADTGTEADITWHKRRVRFMKNMVERILKRYEDFFKPATKQQVTDFIHSATDFWDGKINDRVAQKKYEEMKNILQKKDITIWDYKSYLLWMIEKRDQFAWMWEQWFECISECISDSHFDYLWIELLQKHFPEEIKAWVDEILIE